MVAELGFYWSADLAFWSSNAHFSNSFTIFPRVKVPKSPPFLPDEQRETCLAMSPNFSPFSRRAFMLFASVRVLTDICKIYGCGWLFGMVLYN